jgi:hypothetical protein
MRPTEHFRYYEGIKCQKKLIVAIELVAEHEPNRDKLRDSASSGRWNPLHRVTGTSQVFTPRNEI